MMCLGEHTFEHSQFLFLLLKKILKLYVVFKAQSKTKKMGSFFSGKKTFRIKIPGEFKCKHHHHIQNNKKQKWKETVESERCVYVMWCDSKKLLKRIFSCCCCNVLNNFFCCWKHCRKSFLFCWKYQIYSFA